MNTIPNLLFGYFRDIAFFPHKVHEVDPHGFFRSVFAVIPDSQSDESVEILHHWIEELDETPAAIQVFSVVDLARDYENLNRFVAYSILPADSSHDRK